MKLNNFPRIKEKKKSNAWKIFLILVIFILSIISICFLFHHFKNKSQKDVEKNPSATTENQGNNNSPPGSGNWKLNIDYQPIQNEAEYQDKLIPISSAGTEYKKAVIEANMLPRGSAILTNSGDLEKQGIKAIIHACPGTIQKNAVSEFEPNIQGIIHSVQNSIILAEKNNYKSIAFCLVGSSFLDRIFPNQGTKKKKQLKLAEIIIKSAVEQRKSLEKIVFVDFGNSAFTKVFFENDWGKDFYGKLNGVGVHSGNKWDENKNKVEKRGITDYSLHRCEVIVNSLNMEGNFISSGSFSGFIAGKTGFGKGKIQNEIKKYINEFNKRLKKQY